MYDVKNAYGEQRGKEVGKIIRVEHCSEVESTVEKLASGKAEGAIEKRAQTYRKENALQFFERIDLYEKDIKVQYFDYIRQEYIIKGLSPVIRKRYS